ncbi:hypothetical protein FI667_g2222, partial [Globisporangium splendens]
MDEDDAPASTSIAVEDALRCSGPIAEPSPLKPMHLALRKGVSMGEYDPATGLTHITYQRGRLLFNMGNDANKQAAPMAANSVGVTGDVEEEKTAVEERNASDTTRRKHTSALGVHLRTGPFTGLSLYPEEAHYLLQRGALVVFKASSSLLSSDEGTQEDPKQTTATEMQTLKPLSVAQFVTLLLRHQRVSLACLEVYVFLKENKFHPRRHAIAEQQMQPVSQSTSSSSRPPLVRQISRQQPQHYTPMDGATCRFAYDVWKSTTETVYLPNDQAVSSIDSINDGNNSAATDAAVDEKTETPRATKKKPVKLVKKMKVKQLRLVFRVIVCRFGDAMPPLSAFAAVSRHHFSVDGGEDLQNDNEEAAAVPVKVAVVDGDKTVLFFEVGP